MNESFLQGSQWLQADFHLHTKADKEFSYCGEDNDYVKAYTQALLEAGIGLWGYYQSQQV
jgi:chromosome segregation protein